MKRRRKLGRWLLTTTSNLIIDMSSVSIRWTGTRHELIDKLRTIPKVLSGQLPDPGGVVEGLLLRIGMVLLGKIQEAYITASEGRVNKLGIQWKPLSIVTLLLRRTGQTGSKGLAKLKTRIAGMTIRNQRRIKELYRQQLLILHNLDPYSLTHKTHARNILEKKRRAGLITPTRYNELRKVLDSRLKPQSIEAFALAQATALILRDTGRMLNSLGPGTASADRIARAVPGAVIVGTNVTYFKYHQSSAPRIKKKDGSDKLPRRQVLPDATHPIPQDWWEAMTAECAKGIASKAFLLAVLGPKAA